MERKRMCVCLCVCVGRGQWGGWRKKRAAHTHTYICEPTCHKITNITRRKVGFIQECVCVCVFGRRGWTGSLQGDPQCCRWGVVNMQRMSKLNQTAKLSISGQRDQCMKMASLEGIKALAAPYPWAFLASVQLCVERWLILHANFSQ